MEKNLKDFELQQKNPSEEALRRWRHAFTIVRNRRRRFRMIADLDKRSEAEKEKLKIQEKIREALYIQKAALQMIDETAPLVESSETENSYIIDTGVDNSIGDHRLHGITNIGWSSRKVDLEKIFVITNFVLEILSTALDQLSSVHKPQYALLGMLMSFVAIIMCIVEIVYKIRKKKVTWKWRSTLPWLYYPSQDQKPFGNFKDMVGLVCALCQCIVTTIAFVFVHRHADNPIKVSVWPIVFAFGLLCSKFLEKPEGRNV